MADDQKQYRGVDRALTKILIGVDSMLGLSELFEQRIKELGISQSTALDMLGMQSRTFKGLMEGTQPRVDLRDITLLSEFLQIDRESVFQAIVERIERVDPVSTEDVRKRGYILQNFDLVGLQRMGFIDSITDFEHIEERVKDYFGLESIYDYNKDSFNPAYSSGNRKPKNLLNRAFFDRSAMSRLKRINNYYEYDRDRLKSYIAYIRSHTRDEKRGLYQVTRDLFKLGVTVHYHEPMPSVHVRGATFAVNNKPCIIITDYTPFYPSLWFALIHEIYHVLFDWEEISVNKYHVSTGSPENGLFKLNESAADDFAQNYFVPSAALAKAKPYIGNSAFIEEYAKSLDVHPSFFYSFFCWDANSSHAYKKFSNLIPKAFEALKPLVKNPWQSRKPIRKIAQQLEEEVYNNI